MRVADVAERFDAVQEYYEDQARAGLWESEAALIDEYFTGSSVLDLGCGSGRTSFPLEERGYDVTGVDVSEGMIETARAVKETKEAEPVFHLEDARDLPFDDETFDNVLFSNQGLMQIPGRDNRLAALHEIERVLVPGGNFVFTTHIRTMDGYAWFWTKQWIKHYLLKPIFCIKEDEYGDRFFTEGGDVAYEDPQYIHIPTFDEVQELLEGTSLTLVDHERANEIAGHRGSNPMFYCCTKD